MQQDPACLSSWHTRLLYIYFFVKGDSFETWNLAWQCYFTFSDCFWNVFLVLKRLFMIAYFINSYMHWLAHTIAIVLRKL